MDRERLEDLEDGEEVKNCDCAADPIMPGYVVIGVFCGLCGGYMMPISGDIDTQVEQLGRVQRIIHSIERVKATTNADEATEEGGRRHGHPVRCEHEQYDGSGSPGDTVTVTEAWDGESFRPFGNLGVEP